jgi:hypothetical protein
VEGGLVEVGGKESGISGVGVGQRYGWGRWLVEGGLVEVGGVEK